MVTFESLLGPLSIDIPRRAVGINSAADTSTSCYYSGALMLQGQELLGPGAPKMVWEGLGYEVGIQHFEISLTSAAHKAKMWHADRPIGSGPTSPETAAFAAAGSRFITFQPRKWAPNGQIVVEFRITVPHTMFPPPGAVHRFELAARAIVAIIHKDLGQGPDFMCRTAEAVTLELGREKANWPWPQQAHERRMT
ncbi:hypothetical protein RSOLAG1IB_01112 [Rhizoctonia solani AG-1 IB]|uniref:Uncharacterized protein n=1 Tax=Thanatephorus cucumeris (strain AG1-IB / isolate 7/3/14) TaxID=1108050 RepID=M5C5Q2_THACB|nr:hypothetical protein BN14_09425 [Rhizoctonia solani AG-1 IB]CEL55104.1 hypothetical protein RSOLAG1IB_01112 [Rhizoctonia solani AG-1 IB]